MNAFPVSATCYTLISRFFHPFLYRSQSVPRFSYKVFLQSIHWVQSPSQLVLRFLASIPSSRAPLYTRRARVSIYVFFLVSFSFPSSLKCSQHSFFLPLVVSLRPFTFLPSLSSSVFRSSSFPSCRAHNCITERLFSQLTLSPLFVPILLHFWSFPSRYVQTHRSRDRIVLFVHIYSRTERREQRWHRSCIEG